MNSTPPSDRAPQMGNTPQIGSAPQARDVTAPRANPQGKWICGYQLLGPQTLMLNFAILTAGLLLLSMTLPQREAIFVPGGLSKAHSQILGNHLVSERCSLCHPSSHADVSDFRIQDELCLKCHTKHLPDAHLQSPHDLPREQLASLTNKANPFAKLISSKASIRTTCASCHVEHRGSSFDLTAISDTSCQACHQQSFHSLSTGHPEFDDYPYRSVRHIAFDHAAHQQKHFGAKNETFECRGCHLDDRSSGELGPVFRSVGFEQACSSCHQASIQAATIDGWAIMQLPSIEATDSQDPQHDLSHWPASAQFGYEGQIDVPLRLLLAGDPEMRETLARLPASGKLLDISDVSSSSANNHRGEVARSLARGLRKFIHEVAVDGQAAWQRRLQATASMQLQRELTTAEQQLIKSLSQGVPPDLFRQMHSAWFGSAAEHLAQQHPDGASGVAATALHHVSQTSDSDSLLIEETADDSLLIDDSSALLLTDDSLLDAPQADGLLEGPLDDTALTGPAVPKLAALQGAKHVSAGGWYLDHELLALRYMPLGHADPTLAAWAEYIALLDTAASVPSQLTHGVALPGDCTQCHLLHPSGHSLDSVASWTSASRSSAARPFTKFDHRPHLTLPALEDCSYCHQFSGHGTNSLASVIAEQTQSGWQAVAPQQMTRAACEFLNDEFVDMRREQCGACHRPDGASDRCTQCHNYHVGSGGL